MFKQIEVIFTDGLSGHTGKVVLLSDSKSAVAMYGDKDSYYSNSKTACLCCISSGNAAMLEKATKALGAERLLWEAGWEPQWVEAQHGIATRWPQTIKHELAIPDHQCKTQDEFLSMCDNVAARLP